jgi:hypothetical protein
MTNLGAEREGRPRRGHRRATYQSLIRFYRALLKYQGRDTDSLLMERNCFPFRLREAVVFAGFVG